MGLFSSEYRTTVGTTVSRAVQDNMITSSIKTGLITGLFAKEQNQLIENVLESVVSGMGVRAERMYSYAKRSYTYGLPTAKVSTTADGKAVVQGVLETLIGPGLVMDYYKVGPLNNLHVGWVTLVNTYGYQSSTNQLATLSTQIGYPVYLKDLQAVIKEATLTERENGSLDQWGIAATAGYTPARTAAASTMRARIVPTPFRVDPLAVNDDAVLLTYVWAVPTTTVISGVSVTRHVINEASIIIPVTGYDRTQDFFQVKYTHGAQEGYWLYQLGAGTHPEIDTIFDSTPEAAGEFFPIVYFRKNKTSMSVDTQAAAYKTSARMMKTLGIDYQAIIDGVHENPDIGQVEQAMMMFAVPANTTNLMEQRYLFDFFSKLYLAAGGVGVGVGWDIGGLSGSTGGRRSDAIVDNINSLLGKDVARVRVNIQDSQFSTALSCQGIYKKKKAGVIGAIGIYASSFTTETVTNTYTKREVVGQTGNGENGNPIYGDVEYSYTTPIDLFKYSHQITENVYEEVSVYDLKMTYYVYGSYTTVGDDLSAILLVPLDRAITKTYSIPDKELLYTRSLYNIFNSRVVTEVKWYQQAWFGDLLMIVGVVLTVMSLGVDGGFFANVSAMTAAVAAGTMTIATFIIIMANLLSTFVYQFLAAKLFVRAAGEDLAILTAIVLVVYGGYKSFQAGSIQGAPWAKELLSMGNGLVSAATASVQDAMIGLKKEADAFNLFVKEKTELLEDAQKLLESNNYLSPAIIYGQTPDEFYNKIHVGNIGTLGIDSISSYVDIALTLPKLNDSLGRNNYGYSI